MSKANVVRSAEPDVLAVGDDVHVRKVALDHFRAGVARSVVDDYDLDRNSFCALEGSDTSSQ
jgi:hypothetical protein